MWYMDLSRPLCDTISHFLKKTGEILTCPQPLLFISLSAEFLVLLSEISREHEHRCKRVVELLLNLGMKIE